MLSVCASFCLSNEELDRLSQSMYELCSVKGLANAVILDFLQSVITSWRARELVGRRNLVRYGPAMSLRKICCVV